MELHQMPRQQVIERIDGIIGKITRRGTPTAEDTYLMTSVLRGVEALFMREIRERQARIPGLETGEFGYYISPMSSRRLPYDLMDLAVAEGWDGLVIHDCSNEVKMLRGISDMIPGHINYEMELEGIQLPWFRKAARAYDFTTLAEA